mmetsp:Transcript_7444/g.16115  ORF Transcript_7444/g.16115 Transcript_7444/m.16115 type:complete len:438 (-) Transcript_7444:55-1368(-)
MSRSGNSRQRSFSPSRRIAPNHRYSTYTPPRQRPVQEDPYSHIGDFQSFPERQSFQRTVSGHQSFQPITVRVVAPENLPEGYRFDVVIHPGRPPVSVKVPSGGVRRGQEISVPLSPNPSNGQPPDGSFDGDNSEIDDSSSSSSADSSEYDLEADNQGRIVGKDRLESESRPPPEGEWRVGICRSFFYKCHEGDMVMICLSVILLPQLVLSQVMTRMRLNWLGIPDHHSNPIPKEYIDYDAKTFFTVMAIIFTYNIIVGLIDYFMPSHHTYYLDTGSPSIQRNPTASVLVSFLNFSLLAYTILILVRTRAFVRKRYSISEAQWSCTEGCEDVVCAVALPLCTTTQMLRHTADHDNDEYWCLSATGLSPFEEKLKVYMRKYCCSGGGCMGSSTSSIEFVDSPLAREENTEHSGGKGSTKGRNIFNFWRKKRPPPSSLLL